MRWLGKNGLEVAGGVERVARAAGEAGRAAGVSVRCGEWGRGGRVGEGRTSGGVVGVCV